MIKEKESVRMIVLLSLIFGYYQCDVIQFVCLILKFQTFTESDLYVFGIGIII